MNYPTWFLKKINDYDKALKVNLNLFIKTQEERFRQNYEYYMSERENCIWWYFQPRMSDKDYSNLTIY